MFASALLRSSSASVAATEAYTIRRLPVSGWLPVYRDYRRSNNMVKATVIRRVEGDSQKLLVELSDALKTDGKVNPRNGHVLLKGDHLHAVRDYLTSRGF
ncbi:hypothetical protein BC830DRAFT_1230461 [Chytriomyces sp. MP71]|nr:hypothetical protein BC830DRAFT_1230461 [Chytriomyces sp. MP71]